MEFNWADPRKNKRVDSVMMVKAEASRVKRLTSVKSTVSNQLTPAVEHKLKTHKKKKAAEGDERPSSRLHQREFDPSSTSSSSSGSTTNRSFYTEFLPQPARPKSIFDAFDVHAAADGLFHPASNVQAFAEHDAKYAAAPTSSARSGKGGGDSEPRRLPPLSGNSDRSERLASRSDSRLPTASSSSASSSSSSSSSSSHRGISYLSGNRSDGDLYAPRRVGIVPSSADRSAAELLSELSDDGDDHDYDNHDDDEEEDEEPQAPSPKMVKPQKKATSASVAGAGNNHLHVKATKSAVVPPLEFDLTQKFEQLKRLTKTQGASEQAAKGKNASCSGPEVEDDGDGGDTNAQPRSSDPAAVKESKPKKRCDPTERIKRKDQKLPAKEKPLPKSTTEKKQSAPPPTEPRQLSSTATSSGGLGTMVAKKTKARARELKIRNGVSLSDLRDEHRAALVMLQQLGGPLEPEAAKHKQSKVKSTVKLAVQASDRAEPQAQSNQLGAIRNSPIGSADQCQRLVEKLRARIPSGRDKSPRREETSPPGLEDAERRRESPLRPTLSRGRAQVAEPRAESSEREDDELWNRYAREDENQEEEEEEEEDPSADLYGDDYFEG